MMDGVLSNCSYHNAETSDGEGLESLCKYQDDGGGESVVEVSNGTNKESETGTSGFIPHFLCVSSGVNEADVDLDTAVHLSFFPEHFASGQHLRALFHSDEIYSSYLDYPPWKPVPIGLEHQADIPEWGLQGLGHLDKPGSQVAVAQLSGSGLMADDGNGEKLMGTCVVSMSDFETSGGECSEGGNIRICCQCLDAGSVTCVRQHVMEAREKLRGNLGQKIFEELGFCDMGEEVAKKWSEEEEQAFLYVVLSSPASLGRNFWDHLLSVFPSRTKKELVSYYFNVFKLRKRAEQNRFEPLNVDSDNDEWLKNDGDAEDSGVESPIAQEALAHNQEQYPEDYHEEIDDDDNSAALVSCRVATDEEDLGGIDDSSGAYIGTIAGDCDGDNEFMLQSKIQNNRGDDYDIQDDSRTSYKCQRDKFFCYGSFDAVADARESQSRVTP
ncbi:hypothetical protein CFOL_v3_09219 [Cephalotus follicularis]|uniref:Myb-like domain-containing protein n=1 Tax=Cephalotus follicularis TaxID=3775 RepID=A0A1Q3BCS7_CEPFO|nr:hypothetical protein CFOL_v3_09219 [Cephalotus follicularis]